MSLVTLPTFFISHGGGPWPWMQAQTGASYAALAASLQDMVQQLPQRPRAVLMISGHWEEGLPTVTSAARPGMIYDYGGFPAHTYRIQYPAPGAPELALQVLGRLQQAGIEAAADDRRGFDHGCFVPLALMYPQADVPVVQLSLRRDYDPAAHIAIGRALAALRDEGVLIIGSGLSYHNLRLMGPAAQAPSQAFDDWLQQTLALAPVPRAAALCAWQQAPAARIAHPREDHLLPLMVALGAAHDAAAECIYHEQTFFGGVVVSSFRFGSSAAAP